MTDTGSSRGDPATQAAIQLRLATGRPVIAHVACAGQTQDDLSRRVEALLEGHVDHVLVLRGDVTPKSGGFTHADEAIAFLRRRYPRLVIGAACYPCGHPDDGELGQDIRTMQRKAQAGADFFVSQIVLDHARFRDHVIAAARAGIRVPILPGISVVGSLARLEKVAAHCRFGIPDELRRVCDGQSENYFLRQMVGTARAAWVHGAPGIHLCPFNNPDLTIRFLLALFGYNV